MGQTGVRQEVYFGLGRDFSAREKRIDLCPVRAYKCQLRGEIVGPCRLDKRIPLDKIWVSAISHIIRKIAVIDHLSPAKLGRGAHEHVIDVIANGQRREEKRGGLQRKLIDGVKDTV
jgi:hypothetical protein